MVPSPFTMNLIRQQEEILARAKEIELQLSVSVYVPPGPAQRCASSWEAARLIASLEHRVAELEKWIKAVNEWSAKDILG